MVYLDRSSLILEAGLALLQVNTIQHATALHCIVKLEKQISSSLILPKW